jgi:hypothetical protein
MIGLTRGFSTLLGAAGAGILLWFAAQLDNSTTGGYWAAYGIVAAAGLTMALSQLLGGWTKWGWPEISVKVLLLAFLPVFVAACWVLVASQPDANWARDHVQSWSGSLGIRDVVFGVNDLLGALAFGVGLVFGFTFDTTGPRRVRPLESPVESPVESGAEAFTPEVHEPTIAERTEVTEVGEGDRPVDTADREAAPSRE